jgi:hypothetical protein
VAVPITVRNSVARGVGATRPTDSKGKELRMSGPFIFIATNRLKPGAYESERRRVPGLVDFIEAGEPRLLAFNEYINAERTEVTVVQVHPDAASMEFHMGVVGERAAQAYAETSTRRRRFRSSGRRATQSWRCCVRRLAPACRSASTPSTSEGSRGSGAEAAVSHIASRHVSNPRQWDRCLRFR